MPRSTLFHWLALVLVALLMAGCLRRNPDRGLPTAVPRAATLTSQELALAGAGQPVVPPGFLLYDNPDLGVRLAYPAGWSVALDEGALFFTSPGSTEGRSTLLVYVDDLGILGPETIVEMFDQQFGPLDDRTPRQPLTETAINGQLAAQAIYEGRLGETPVTATYTAVVREERGAILVALTPRPESDGPDLATMIGTFVLTAPTNTTGSTGRVGRTTDIAPGAIYRASLVAGSVDEFNFAARPAQRLLVIVDAYDQLDVQLAVLDAAGRILVEADQALAGESEALRFVAPEDGRFTIRVGGFLGAGGDYAIGLLNEAPDAADVRLVQAGTVPGEGRVFYQLPVAAGRALLLAATPAGGFDVNLEFYDTRGNLVQSRADLSARAGAPETHIFFAPQPGDYLVALVGAHGAGGGFELLVGDGVVVTLP